MVFSVPNIVFGHKPHAFKAFALVVKGIDRLPTSLIHRFKMNVTSLIRQKIVLVDSARNTMSKQNAKLPYMIMS